MTTTKSFGKVKPLFWENHLLLSFDVKWIDVIGTIPVFEVMIDEKRRLHLIGPQIKKMMINNDENKKSQ